MRYPKNGFAQCLHYDESYFSENHRILIPLYQHEPLQLPNPNPQGGATMIILAQEFEKVPREQAYSLVNEIRTFHFSLSHCQV